MRKKREKRNKIVLFERINVNTIEIIIRAIMKSLQ